MEKVISSSSGGSKKAHRRGHKLKPKMTKEERCAKYTAIARGRRERSREKGLVCYRCRKTGHSAQNCPEPTTDGGGGGEGGKGAMKKKGGNICYKCGSMEHRIQVCPKIKPWLRKGKLDFGKLGDLPYANCYVCNKSGHLASHCPESDKGVYPKGGSCRICESVAHFAADCPENPENKKGRKRSNNNLDGSDVCVKVVTIDEYLEEPVVEKKVVKSEKKKKKVVNFRDTSG